MSIHYKATTLTILFILLAACGNAQPTAAPGTPTKLGASPTHTPHTVEVTATPEPTAIPATPRSEAFVAAVSFVDSGQRLGFAQSWDVALGDLDGDGDLDAFVANSAQGEAKNGVWINDGQGSFTLSEQTPGYGQGIALGDLDRDGDLDVVVTHWWGDEQSTIWLNDGLGIFAASEDNLGKAFRPVLGDLDGDGDLDIFLAQMEANTVWLNDGRAVFSDSGQRLGTGITAAVALDDLDGDGDLDALTGGWEEAAKVWLNDGAGIFSEHEPSLSAAAIHIHDLVLGDVDGDGDADAFMAVASGDPHQVWFNDGRGSFRESDQQLHAPLAHGVSLGDVDGDGDLDALTAHGDRASDSSGGKIWLNDGTGHFDESDLNLGDLYSVGAALGDLDGDGDLDAFIAHGETWREGGGELPNDVWVNETTGPSLAAATPTSVRVPPGSSPTIDGVLSPGEWEDAAVFSLTDGSDLLLMQDDDYLYLGVRSATPEMIGANVFVAAGEQVKILHTSAALGTAIYQRRAGHWQQTQDFDWRCRSTDDGAAALAERAAYLQENHWLAANSRMGAPHELEYKIARTGALQRVAVSVFRSSTPNERAFWPPTLGDDTIRPNPGGLPMELRLLPEQWAPL